MSAEDIKQDLQKRMDGAITSFKHTLSGLRTGRASASLLDPIKVEIYGDFIAINQIATISVPEARTINVQVWDKSSVKAVEKAISNAGLGLNPVSDGQLVRVPIPDLSEQRRKELSKKVGEYAEHARIALRNIRRDSIDDLKKMEKDKAISEDELKTNTTEIQKITDSYNSKVEELSIAKSKEIMGV